MKLIIAGSRNYDHGFIELIDIALDMLGLECPEEAVSGGCRGIDKLGEGWAVWHDIPIKSFPANWEKYGRSAGPRRNQQMANYADAALVIYDGNPESGSANMINQMKKLGKPVYTVTLRKER